MTDVHQSSGNFFYLCLHLIQTIVKITATKQATRIAPPTAIITHAHAGNAVSPPGGCAGAVKLTI